MLYVLIKHLFRRKLFHCFYKRFSMGNRRFWQYTMPQISNMPIAAKIIEQQEGDFDPSQFKDHYEEALRALIREKEKGAGRKVTVDEPKGAEVIDLMEALRRSLAGDSKGAATKPAAKKAPPAKKRA